MDTELEEVAVETSATDEMLAKTPVAMRVDSIVAIGSTIEVAEDVDTIVETIAIAAA